MRYDQLLTGIKRAEDRYEAEIRRLLAEFASRDATAVAALLAKKAKPTKTPPKNGRKTKGKTSRGYWTSERRAKQSAALKAFHARKTK